MHSSRLLEAFELRDGRLFWREPPKNHAEKVGAEAGFINRGKGSNKDYWQVRLDGKTFKRSRVVYCMVHGCWPEPCVDHIDGNSLNDRPGNLREATHRQNAQNAAAHIKASGLPRGVTNYMGRYRATIQIDGKRRVLGAFDSPADASAAYETSRKELFNEFA